MSQTATRTQLPKALSAPSQPAPSATDGLRDSLSDPLGGAPPSTVVDGYGVMGDESIDTAQLPSSTRLKAERAALHAKKAGARALDVALFAPMHAIDQASILDVHAVDAANFLASGKTRAQRNKSGEDDRFNYTPSYTGGLTRSVKGRQKLREAGRTHLRPMMNEGSHIGASTTSLGAKDGVKGFLGKKKWGWGEGVLGANPVKELHRASMPEEASPETKDNTRLAEIRNQLDAKKRVKKATKAWKNGGGGPT